LGSKGFRLDLRPRKLYFIELKKKYYIKSAQKHLNWSLFHVEVKKEPTICMAATPRNLFLRSKMKTNSIWTNSFNDPKGEVSNLKSIFQKAGGQYFHLDSHEIAPDGRRQTVERRIFFFRKNRFFSDKKS
jgi:hypothetical protein